MKEMLKTIKAGIMAGIISAMVMGVANLTAEAEGGEVFKILPGRWLNGSRTICVCPKTPAQCHCFISVDIQEPEQQ